MIIYKHTIKVSEQIFNTRENVQYSSEKTVKLVQQLTELVLSSKFGAHRSKGLKALHPCLQMIGVCQLSTLPSE